MGKILIVYYSSTGRTRRMGELIAEGIRFTEHQAVTKETSDIQGPQDLDGYDGYLFGSPTYYSNIADPVKDFLSVAAGADLAGKLAGAFGSHAHGGDAPGLILEKMESEFNMRPFDLGAFKLLEADVPTQEGMRACHDYGRTFAERLPA
jgi:flavodoxin